MKFESLKDSKFKNIENEAFLELNSINGGEISYTTNNQNDNVGYCYEDQWYLFKKNNPTNTNSDGTPSGNEDGHEWVDISNPVNC